jgi:NYN domain/OST-HTH/LOTUS domain
MSFADGHEGRNVALYWDFENLHASLVEAKTGEGYASKPDLRFKLQEPLIAVRAIIELAASFGPIAINRAYCNWQFFGRYRDALLQGAVELIQLFPPGASAKNGADIRLCLDAADDIARFPHIGTVLIVGGDSDFMPVAQRIKAAGRTLVGIGARRSTNRHWARSCHDFRYYESLVDDVPAPWVQAEGQRVDDPAAEAKATADYVLRRAVKLLANALGDPWVNKAALWPMVKRLDPSFDPKDLGHESFAAMLKAADGQVVEIRSGEFDQQVRVLAP